MKNAVILCAGAGTKVWPYAEIRCKAMIKVSNKPIAAYSVDILTELGFEKIVIVGSSFIQEIKSYFRDYKNVEVIEDKTPKGTAFSLLSAEGIIGKKDFLALYGDTIIGKSDIEALIKSYEENKCDSALISKANGRNSDIICCDRDETGCLSGILGHAREGSGYFCAGYAFTADIFEKLKYNSCRFTSTEVGMMSPIEGYIEMTLSDEISRGAKIKAVEAQDRVFDIDKPWQILEANAYINRERCSALKRNELAEGAYIDQTAVINGYVKLGKNSFIGKNVIIDGNIIVGDNTHIINGALVQGNVVIGNDTSVRNACFVSGCSTIGDECIVSHAAELDGIIFSRVYLYHYMEFCGIIGENTDLGAATVCGSLRFDDGTTMHNIKGRREFPGDYADSVFLGDYCRTGVNAILMPGVKVGVYSIVGAGVLLNRDLKNNTLLYSEQNQVEKHWGPEKYGW